MSNNTNEFAFYGRVIEGASEELMSGSFLDSGRESLLMLGLLGIGIGQIAKRICENSGKQYFVKRDDCHFACRYDSRVNRHAVNPEPWKHGDGTVLEEYQAMIDAEVLVAASYECEVTLRVLLQRCLLSRPSIVVIAAIMPDRNAFARTYLDSNRLDWNHKWRTVKVRRDYYSFPVSIT